MLTNRDWTLLALDAAGSDGLSPAQLQKSLFLLAQAIPKGGSFYRFRPYNYGPFSAEIYSDAETMSREGLVHILNQGYTWARRYRATSAGQERAKEVSKAAPEKPLSYLRAVVAWAMSLSFQDLVRAIYDRFPDQRANSVFNG